MLRTYGSQCKAALASAGATFFARAVRFPVRTGLRTSLRTSGQLHAACAGVRVGLETSLKPANQCHPSWIERYRAKLAGMTLAGQTALVLEWFGL